MIVETHEILMGILYILMKNNL